MAKENEKKSWMKEREKGGRHDPFGAFHKRKRIMWEDKRQVLTENMNICLPWCFYFASGAVDRWGGG